MPSYRLSLSVSDDTVSLEGIISSQMLAAPTFSDPFSGMPFNSELLHWVFVRDNPVTFSLGDIIFTTGLETCHQGEPISEYTGGIGAKIDEVIADPDSYEPGEEHPSQDAIIAMKRLLAQANEAGHALPTPSVSTFHGELDVTWRADNRTLRVVTYSNGRAPLLYFYIENGDALTRGLTIQPVTAQQLSERIAWLVG